MSSSSGEPALCAVQVKFLPYPTHLQQVRRKHFCPYLQFFLRTFSESCCNQLLLTRTTYNLYTPFLYFTLSCKVRHSPATEVFGWSLIFWRENVLVARAGTLIRTSSSSCALGITHHNVSENSSPKSPFSWNKNS